MTTNKKNNNFGFTLLETIVAVSILVTAIVGPFSLASQSINAQGRAKNNLIAANLAQEGLELFRNYRANNILKMLKDANDAGVTPDYSHWLDGTGDEASGTVCWSLTGCGIDAVAYIQSPGVFPMPDLPNCSDLPSGCVLYLSSEDVYSHGLTGAQTKFHRKINIETISVNPPEVKVTATVWWSDSLGNDQFSVTTHLMNW